MTSNRDAGSSVLGSGVNRRCCDELYASVRKYTPSFVSPRMTMNIHDDTSSDTAITTSTSPTKTPSQPPYTAHITIIYIMTDVKTRHLAFVATLTTCPTINTPRPPSLPPRPFPHARSSENSKASASINRRPETMLSVSRLLPILSSTGIGIAGFIAPKTSQRQVNGRPPLLLSQM